MRPFDHAGDRRATFLNGNLLCDRNDPGSVRHSSANCGAVHLHVCFADGVFEKSDDERIRLRALAPPTNEDVDSVACKVVRRMAKLLERHFTEHRPTTSITLWLRLRPS